MADTIGTVRVELIADPSGIQRGIEQASGALTRMAAVGAFVGTVVANAFMNIAARFRQMASDLLSGQGDVWDRLSSNAQSALTQLNSSLNQFGETVTSVAAQVVEQVAPGIAVLAERILGADGASRLAKLGVDIFAGAVKVLLIIANNAVDLVMQLTEVFSTFGQVAGRVGQAFVQAWQAIISGDFAGAARAFGSAFSEAQQIMARGWERMKAIGAETMRTDAEIWNGVAGNARRAGQVVGEVTDEMKRHMRQLAHEADRVFEMTRTPAERMQIEIDKLNANPFITGETLSRAIDMVKDKYSGLRDTLRSLGQSIASTFTDALIEGKKFGDMLQGLLKSILRIVANKIFTDILLGSNTKQGGVGGLLGGLSGLLGFAQGGSFTVGGAGGVDSQVAAFRATPGERVTVSKPGQGMGGGGTTVVQNITFPNSMTAQDKAVLRAEMERSRQLAVSEANSSVRESIRRDPNFLRA